MSFIDQIKANNETYDIELKRLLRGDSAPTVTTVGEVGYLYVTKQGELYQCTSIQNGYHWVKFVNATELAEVGSTVATNKAAAEQATQNVANSVTALQQSVEGRLNSLESAPKLSFEYVENKESLPAKGTPNVIYLTKDGEEYVWKDTAYELFGTIVDVDVDLSNYYTKSDTDQRITAQINALRDEIESSINYAVPTIDFDVYPQDREIEITQNGGVFNLSGIYHKETNVNNIQGLLNLYKDGVKIRNNGITPSTSGVSLSDGIVDNNTITTAKTIVYSLEGVDKKGTPLKAEKRVSFFFAGYLGVSNQTFVTTDLFSKFTKTKELKGDVSVNILENGYIWFLTTKNITKITSNGFEVPFGYVQEIGYNNGTYKCYKTTNQVVAGSYKFNIN